MKVFHIQENFISEEDCQKIIDLYNDNSKKSFQYRDTFPIFLPPIANTWIINLSNDLLNFCQSLSTQKIRLDNSQIVKWPTGSFQDAHYDHGDAFAAIIYLNENFYGGKTCFQFKNDQIKVTPEIGKCVIFSNDEYLHWVEKIQKGTRFTLAYWFVHEKEDSQ